MPASDTLFVNSFDAGASFLIDVADPLNPKVAGAFREMGEYTYPHTFERLPNGNVLATFQTKGEHNEVAGGLVELDPAGNFVRASAASDPVDPELREPLRKIRTRRGPAPRHPQPRARRSVATG